MLEIVLLGLRILLSPLTWVAMLLQMVVDQLWQFTVARVILIVLATPFTIVLSLLLLILCLMLVTLFVVLLVPLKYRGDFCFIQMPKGLGGLLPKKKGEHVVVSEEPEALQFEIRITWLFSLIRGYVIYQEQVLDWQVTVLHKSINLSEEEQLAKEQKIKQWEKRLAEKEKLKQKRANKKATVSKATKPQAPKERTVAYEKPREKAVDAKTAEEKTLGAKVSESTSAEQNVKRDKSSETKSISSKAVEDKVKERVVTKRISGQSSPDEFGKTKSTEEENIKDFDDTIEKSKRGFSDKVEETFEKIEYTYAKFYDKINALLEKKEWLIRLLEDENNHRIVARLWKEVNRLARFLRPKKITADITFGFENPATTGYVLAGISVIYPHISKSAKFQADFEQEVLEGSMSIKGKVRVAYMAIFLLNIWLDSSCRKVIKELIGKALKAKSK